MTHKHGLHLGHLALKKDPMALLSVVTDAPWQIIDKKKKKEDKIEATSIQSVFVAAKGSVPVKSGNKRKLEEPENLSPSAKKQRQLR